MSPAAVLFSSARVQWATPRATYEALHAEFGFTLDPCDLDYAGALFSPRDGLLMSWAGQRVFCNPPYGPGIPDWLAKAREADVAVYLLPARTDTRWFHAHCLHADEIRFLRGRLKFGGAKYSAPFPSMVVVYRRAVEP